MIGYILLSTGKRGRLICGSLQYDVFVGRANAFACESAMLKLKREVEMGRVKAAGEGGGESFVCQCTEFSERTMISGRCIFSPLPLPPFPLSP